MGGFFKGALGRLIGVGVAIVIALVGALIWNKGQEKVEAAKAPKVGECINISGSSMSADHTELKCSDPKATYKVAGNKGGCDEVEQNYTITLGTGTDKRGNVADLCLVFNAEAGDCFDPGGMMTPAAKVDCAAATGSSVFKVASVGKLGDTCAAQAQALENRTRKTVLCLVANQ